MTTRNNYCSSLLCLPYNVIYTSTQEHVNMLKHIKYGCVSFPVYLNLLRASDPREVYISQQVATQSVHPHIRTVLRVCRVATQRVLYNSGLSLPIPLTLSRPVSPSYLPRVAPTKVPQIPKKNKTNNGSPPRRF